jgi:hypothetical protein
MGIVRKIEDVLQSLYAYFSRSLQEPKNLVDFVDIVEIGGQKNLRNIKTR